MKEIENLKEELRRAQESTHRIEEKIKELESQTTKRWRAEDDETEFFYITPDGDVDYDYDYDREDECYDFGNYFKTREEAEEVADKIAIYTKLNDLATKLNAGEKIDWKDSSQTKYSIRLKGDTLFQDFNGRYRCIGQIYCLDSNFLNEALNVLEEDEIKKLF